MDINEFITNNDVGQSNDTINVSMIEQTEKAVGVHFDEELSRKVQTPCSSLSDPEHHKRSRYPKPQVR